jgi:very-short-patch-repair endonuclease
MTDAEHQVWRQLRDRRFRSLKFRRQYPIGPYFADFACPALKLVVELDGGQHAERAEPDQRRSEYLARHGFVVFRVWNNDVFKNMTGVLEGLSQFVERNG